MKKLFTLIIAVLLLSITANAQTEVFKATHVDTGSACEDFDTDITINESTIKINIKGVLNESIPYTDSRVCSEDHTHFTLSDNEGELIINWGDAEYEYGVTITLKNPQGEEIIFSGIEL